MKNVRVTIIKCPKCFKKFSVSVDLDTMEMIPKETPCCYTDISINNTSYKLKIAQK